MTVSWELEVALQMPLLPLMSNSPWLFHQSTMWPSYSLQAFIRNYYMLDKITSLRTWGRSFGYLMGGLPYVRLWDRAWHARNRERQPWNRWCPPYQHFAPQPMSRASPIQEWTTLAPWMLRREDQLLRDGEQYSRAWILEQYIWSWPLPSRQTALLMSSEDL